MSETIKYIHLSPGDHVPRLDVTSPFRAVVIVENQVVPEWQGTVSDWLVQSGCLYMMAWGIGCSSWDDSVDMANLEAFDYGEIPEDRFVMTTWHSDEPLSDVFWFAKNTASHPTIDLDTTVIIHISKEPSASAMMEAYDEA